MKNLLVFLLVGVFSLSANASLMFRDDIANSSSWTNGSWSFGTIFTVGSDDILITSLGAYDFGANGFTSNSIQVGIYDELSGSLLSSANVLSSDTLIGTYRYANITNLLLTAGSKFRLVAVSANDSYDLTFSDDAFHSAFKVNGYGYCSSTTLRACNTNTEGDYSMGNFLFNVAGQTAPSVPAPATLGLFGLALLAMRRLRNN